MLKKIVSTSIIILFIGLGISVVGLLKEIYVAYEFGTNAEVDIYYLALSIPFFIAALFSSAINATVIPAYLEQKVKGNTVSFFINSAKITLIFLFSATLLSILFTLFVQPYLLSYSYSKSKMVIQAGLILSPIIFLQGVVSFLDGVLNAERKVVLNNLFSLLIPLGTILLLFIFNQRNFIILCMGLYIGYGSKLFFQILLINKLFNFRKEKILPLNFRDYKYIIQEFFWLVFSSSILGVIPVIANYYASYLDAGSVASLSYARKLLSTGLMVVGIVINSVLFPYIAQEIVNNKEKGIKLGLWLAFLSIIMFSILIVPIFILSDEIVGLFFERGEFTHQSTMEVAYILKYFLLYIPFYVAGLLLSRLVVSLNISRVFIAGNIISLLLFMSIGWLMIDYLGRGVESLGIAYVLVYLISTFYLLFHIIKQRKINAY